MLTVIQAIHRVEAAPDGRLLVRALLALGALGETPGLLEVLHELVQLGTATRSELGIARADVDRLVEIGVVRYVLSGRQHLASTTMGRAVVALDDHQHERELGSEPE